MKISLVILALMVFGETSAHDWGFGSCPSVPPFNDLSMEKFLGMWYVIQQFDTTSTCLTFNYTRVSETQLTVTKHRQFYLLDKAGLDHTNSYTGTLDIPFANNPAVLRVKWPLNAAGKADYVIFDTDYSTYAGVYDCQQIAFFMYRESAAILSRTPTLEKLYTDRIIRRLESFKVDVGEFSLIDHSNCKSADPDFKLNVDQHTFKNFFNDALDSVQNFGQQVATGATNAYHTVAEVAKDSYDTISTGIMGTSPVAIKPINSIDSAVEPEAEVNVDSELKDSNVSIDSGLKDSNIGIDSGLKDSDVSFDSVLKDSHFSIDSGLKGQEINFISELEEKMNGQMKDINEIEATFENEIQTVQRPNAEVELNNKYKYDFEAPEDFEIISL